MRKNLEEGVIKTDEELDEELMKAIELVEPEEMREERTPAQTLPGWVWIDYGDASGHLESPDGQYYFSYDLWPYWAIGAIEYMLCSDRGWYVFDGSLSNFKLFAENWIRKEVLV